MGRWHEYVDYVFRHFDDYKHMKADDHAVLLAMAYRGGMYFWGGTNDYKKLTCISKDATIARVKARLVKANLIHKLTDEDRKGLIVGKVNLERIPTDVYQLDFLLKPFKDDPLSAKTKTAIPPKAEDGTPQMGGAVPPKWGDGYPPNGRVGTPQMGGQTIYKELLENNYIKDEEIKEEITIPEKECTDDADSPEMRFLMRKCADAIGHQPTGAERKRLVDHIHGRSFDRLLAKIDEFIDARYGQEKRNGWYLAGYFAKLPVGETEDRELVMSRSYMEYLKECEDADGGLRR